MKISGADILIEELVRQGITTIFGYPGGAVLDIYNSLYKNQNRLTHIISAHEQGAVHAADGYARVTGNVGVVFATSGPGATNLVTGIANAYLDSVPLIAITGNVAIPLLGRDSFQEVDVVGITMPIVKHNYALRKIEDLAPTIREAFKIARSGRPGPVLIDIPKDIQQTIMEYDPDEKIETEDFVNISDDTAYDLKAAICAVNEAKRPFIYCGGGVVAANAGNEVIELSQKISAPIGLSMMGITAVPNDYELNLGMTGMHGKYTASMTKHSSDLIIALGVRFSDRATGNKQAYRGKRTIIHIDIDPAEINKNIPADIELCGDIKKIVNELIAAIKENHHPKWHKQIEKFKEEESAYRVSGDELTAKCIIEMVNSYTDDETVVATDVGQHQMWTAQYYKFQNPRTLLTSGGLGTMGYGLGAAIGGCIASDRKKTVLFTGDGSFGMNLNELATAVSQNLPIVVIIVNNGVLGMVRQWQHSFYDDNFSQTTLNRKTDFALLAESFGAKGRKASTAKELEEILKRDFKSSGPLVIDCKVNMNERVFPLIPAGKSVDDMITE